MLAGPDEGRGMRWLLVKACAAAEPPVQANTAVAAAATKTPPACGPAGEAGVRQGHGLPSVPSWSRAGRRRPINRGPSRLGSQPSGPSRSTGTRLTRNQHTHIMTCSWRTRRSAQVAALTARHNTGQRRPRP